MIFPHARPGLTLKAKEGRRRGKQESSQVKWHLILRISQEP